MKYQEPTPEDYLHIAEKVRSGEYFREARSMYDISVNDPMAERYFYVFITSVALISFLTSLLALDSLYPLSRSVPFVYMLNDVVEDLPSIAPLRSGPQQSVDDAVLIFLAKTFVDHYESYNISSLEKNYGGVEHASTPEVLAGYQRLMDTGNPDSPIIKYQRHSVRNVNILSTRILSSPRNTVEVVFEASVENDQGAQKTMHRATLSYTFNGVELDPETDMVKPLAFQVTNYSTKMIQDTP